MSCVTCHFTCHVSHVTCHVSRVTCHNFFLFFFSFFFRTKWWSLSVEGLLSTGPTPSSFNSITILPLFHFLLFDIKYLGSFLLNCDYCQNAKMEWGLTKYRHKIELLEKIKSCLLGLPYNLPVIVRDKNFRKKSYTTISLWSPTHSGNKITAC